MSDQSMTVRIPQNQDCEWFSLIFKFPLSSSGAFPGLQLQTHDNGPSRARYPSQKVITQVKKNPKEYLSVQADKITKKFRERSVSDADNERRSAQKTFESFKKRVEKDRKLTKESIRQISESDLSPTEKFKRSDRVVGLARARMDRYREDFREECKGHINSLEQACKRLLDEAKTEFRQVCVDTAKAMAHRQNKCLDGTRRAVGWALQKDLGGKETQTVAKYKSKMLDCAQSSWTCVKRNVLTCQKTELPGLEQWIEPKKTKLNQLITDQIFDVRSLSGQELFQKLGAVLKSFPYGVPAVNASSNTNILELGGRGIFNLIMSFYLFKTMLVFR